MDSSILLELLPQELKSKTGITALSEVTETPIIGLYFSAHWCPPCRGFTPILSEFYKKVNEEKKQIEIIFVSCDRDLKSFNEYYDSMPWLTIPFENEMRDTISEAFGINGIPALLIFDNKGNLIDTDGRNLVQKMKGSGFNKENSEKIIQSWSDKIKK